jgi:hypothetical protein
MLKLLGVRSNIINKVWISIFSLFVFEFFFWSIVFEFLIAYYFVYLPKNRYLIVSSWNVERNEESGSQSLCVCQK